MSRRTTALAALAALLLALGQSASLATRGPAVEDAGGGAPRTEIARGFGALPMSFEPNVGQTDERVRFLARGRGYTVFLTDDEVTLSMARERGVSPERSKAEGSIARRKTPEAKGQARARDSLRVRFVGARAQGALEAERPLPGRSNYLSGSDASRWFRNVPTYAAVRRTGVYDGIDTLFYGNQQRLEYDFVVGPGADPGQIRIRFEGHQGLRVDEYGDLYVRIRGGELRQQRAVAFQGAGPGVRPVAVRYVPVGEDEVSIAAGAYDTSEPLVVDPVLVFAPVAGGGQSPEQGNAIAIDGDGAVYVTGKTMSWDYPTSAGAFDATFSEQSSLAGDAFVTKLSPDASTIEYSTYLGGSADDAGYGIAVDGGGAAYVAGETASSDYPTTPGAFVTSHTNTDPFVTKLSPDGSSLLYSTFIGNRTFASAWAIAVNSSGEAYVTGYMSQFPFPTTPGAFDREPNGAGDAFVTRLAANGASLVYSTLLGGTQLDLGYSIDVDASGAAYVVGLAGDDFPTTPGAFDTTQGGSGDAFLTKLVPNGSALAYSTHLGGADEDQAFDVAVDAAGAAHVTGSTLSTDFPVMAGAVDSTHNGWYDAFVVKASPEGAALEFSTLLGGEDGDWGEGIAVDASGAVYVAGITHSSAFPATVGAFDQTFAAWSDGFVAGLSAGGTSLEFSTFLGGAGLDLLSDVAVGADGAPVVVGSTDSLDYPVTAGAASGPPDFEGVAVTKVAPTGASLVYSTKLGGVAGGDDESADVPGGISVDSAGAVYVAGGTDAASYPTTAGGFDESFNSLHENDGRDAFVTKVSADGGSLVYSTFLGGALGDYCAGISVDGDGSARVAGSTYSLDFPTTAGAYGVISSGGWDAFVAELSADGSDLVFSTLVGGGEADECLAMAAEPTGAVVLTGRTYSADYPTSGSAAGQGRGDELSDVFVTKVNPDGSSLGYSVVLGGGELDAGYGIALDSAGCAYVTGETRSADFPVTTGALDESFNGLAFRPDAFVTKLGADGVGIAYSTYLGGAGYDQGYGIAVDAEGRCFVAGTTESTDFPTTPAAFNPTPSASFVTKLDADGTGADYSTYLGGNSGYCAGIAIDANGSAYVTGAANVPFFTPTPGALPVDFDGGRDAFVLKLAPDGGSLAYATYLGGASGGESGTDIVLDASGSVYVAGVTSSGDFFAPRFGYRDGLDAFVAKLRLPVPSGGDTPASYVRSQGQWFLRNANSSGPAQVSFYYGAVDSPFEVLAADWDGDGVDTPGLYDPGSGAFFLTNQLTGGPADFVFYFGAGTNNGGPSVVPLVGDWDGDGTDTVGLYVVDSGVFYLRNVFANGPADETFTFGAGGTGYRPITGDWDGDGAATVGLYVEATGVFFLRNANASGPADVTFLYGAGGATPLAGDWNGDGVDTVGLFAAGAWFLKNANAPGPADLAFSYGPADAEPIVGDWDGQ